MILLLMSLWFTLVPILIWSILGGKVVCAVDSKQEVPGSIPNQNRYENFENTQKCIWCTTTSI